MNTAYLFEIPLKPMSQTLNITINKKVYCLRIIWRGTGYVLDILDENMKSILCGLSLVTGADILDQFDYINFGFGLIVVTDIDASLVPTYFTLGVSSHLDFFYEVTQ